MTEEQTATAEPVEPPRNIYQRIQAIQQAVGAGIAPTGENKEQGYSYITEDDVLSVVKPLEIEHGVLLIPTVIERISAPTGGTTSKGSPWISTAIRFAIDVVNVDDPADRIRVEWWGEGQDFSDKGTYKAYTGGLRHFRLKLYGVATTDDPEADTGRPNGGVTPTRAGGRSGVSGAPTAPTAPWKLRPADQNQRDHAARRLEESRPLISAERIKAIEDALADPKTLAGRMQGMIAWMNDQIARSKREPTRNAPDEPTTGQRDTLAELMDTRVFGPQAADLYERASAVLRDVERLTYQEMEALILDVGRQPEKFAAELEAENQGDLPFGGSS